MINRRVGPYTIVAARGAGGVGDVYRASDSKLGRDVAIKILPAHFSADPERRFPVVAQIQVLRTGERSRAARRRSRPLISSLVHKYAPGRLKEI
jgi:serine/threonine protein kinase